MVKKILAKLKTKATRIFAAALAAVILLLNIEIFPAMAAAIPIPYIPGIEHLVPTIVGIAGAGGIEFGTIEDAQNFVYDMEARGEFDTYRDAVIASGMLDSVYDEAGNYIGEYVRTFVNDAGETVTEVSMDIMDGASQLLSVGMDKVEGLFNLLSESLNNYFNPTETEVEAGIVSNSHVNGYIGGVVSTNAVLYTKYGQWIRNKGRFDASTNQDDHAASVLLGYLGKEVYVFDWMRGESVKIKITEIVDTSKQIGVRFIYTGVISEDTEMKPSKPFTATVDPFNNIITNPPGAISAVAALGGIVGTPGAYTKDDTIGLAIPIPGTTGTLTNVKPKDVVIDMFQVVDIPQATTKPDVTTKPTTNPSSSPSPSPSPSPVPIKVPPLAPILGGLANIIGNINKAKETAEETAADDGALGNTLDDFIKELNDLINQLNQYPEDDPNLLPQLEAAQNTITELQNKIAEQEQAIKDAPEKYPDPALLDEIQDLQKELEELKQNMSTEPGTNPNPTPGTSPDYTNLLERIIALLTSIKESVVAMPETLSEAVIGSGELKPPGRGGAGEEDNDDDDDFDWTTIFPFCIPFDLAKMFESLVGSPAPPRFEAEIMGYRWVMDFAEYDYIAQIIRVGLWISFMVWLMVMTSRFIKWH